MLLLNKTCNEGKFVPKSILERQDVFLKFLNPNRFYKIVAYFMLLKKTDKLLVHILVSIAYILDRLKFNEKKVQLQYLNFFWLGKGGLKIKNLPSINN